MLDLFRCPLEGFVQRSCLLSHGDRLMFFKARLHDASFVMTSRFISIYFTEMDFDSCDVLREIGEVIFDKAFSFENHRIMTLDIVIGIYFNFHVEL